MVWAKVVVPVLLVAAGGTAAVAARSSSETVRTGGSAVWIDNPPGGRAYAPGTISVQAHAVAGTDIAALVLSVDGDEVATDRDLEVDGDLVFATFRWEATVGDHELVVAQDGGDGSRSDPRQVTIAEGAPPAPETAADEPEPKPSDETTTTTATGESTTTATSTTTTSTPAQTTTTAGGGMATTTSPVTVAPTAPPTIPPTTAPRPRPQIQRAALSFLGSAPRVYVRPTCPGYTVDVVALVRDASSVTAVVEGTSVGPIALGTSDGATFQATLRSGIWRDSDAGNRRVIVTARNAGGAVTATAGTVQVIVNCPKD